MYTSFFLPASCLVHLGICHYYKLVHDQFQTLTSEKKQPKEIKRGIKQTRSTPKSI